MMKYLICYVIGLLLVYFNNELITDLFSGKQAVTKLIELTLPLTVPSLVYLFEVRKSKQEHEHIRKQKEENLVQEERDKFEKSLPFFMLKRE